MFRAIVLAALAVGLTACASVQSDVSVFHTKDVERPNTFHIEPAPILANSLEAKTYADLIAEDLKAKGWSPAPRESAEVDIVFAYAIDNGTQETTVAPIYGQTSGGTSHTFGTVTANGGFGTYSGTTYTAPTYGVVGAVPVTTTVYDREFVLDMFKTSDGTKVYESRVASQGTSGSVDEVAKCLIDALFSDFPGKSGQHRTVTVEMNKCKIA